MSDSVQPHRRQPTRLPRPWDSPGKNTGVGCHFLLQCMKVKSESEVPQSCLTLSDPMDYSPPGPPSMGFSRQEYWSGVPLPSPVPLYWCIYIYNCYSFFLDWSFGHYVVSFFVSFHSLYFSLFYLIWVLLLLICFGLHLHEISFSSPSPSVCMCPLFWGGLLKTAYIGVFFGIHSASVCPLLGAFNPFTFEVIIDKYDPVAIYFVVLGSSLYTFSISCLEKSF